MSTITVRPAAPGDFPAIVRIAVATGQDEEWAGSDPAYLAYLLEHATLVVAERDGSVAGFGATRLIGAGADAVSGAARPAAGGAQPRRCVTFWSDLADPCPTCRNDPTDAMMLCVENKMLHDPLPDEGFGPFAAANGTGGRDLREYPRDGHAGPETPHEQHRREVLLRVARISDALNQRLAL